MFAALTGAHQVVISLCNSAALILLNLALKCVMPLLRLNFGWKEKNISFPNLSLHASTRSLVHAASATHTVRTCQAPPTVVG